MNFLVLQLREIFYVVSINLMHFSQIDCYFTEKRTKNFFLGRTQFGSRCAINQFLWACQCIQHSVHLSWVAFITCLASECDCGIGYSSIWFGIGNLVFGFILFCFIRLYDCFVWFSWLVALTPDTCLNSIQRDASSSVLNSTKAKPLDAPKRGEETRAKERHKKYTISIPTNKQNKNVATKLRREIVCS